MLPADGGLPERIHLVPAGELRMHRQDNIKPLGGKCPMLCSFDASEPVERVPIDVNHAYAKRGDKGEETPAFGWITGLELNLEGVWGKVEWNERGKAAIAGREYRGISAELMCRDGEIIGIRGASLTNFPNLKGLTPLFQSATEDNTFMDKILKDLLAKLGLKEDATPEAVLQSVTALVAKQDSADKMRVGMLAIAKAVGVAEGAPLDTVLQSVTALAATATAGGADEKAVAALKAELQTVATELATFKGAAAKDKATAFVDGAIAEGRVGVKPLREHYIARHMQSATSSAEVEKEIGAMPKLSGTTIIPAEQPKDGAVLMTAEETEVCKALNLTPEAFMKTKAARAAAING